MTAKKGRKRSKGEQRSIATAEKHRQQDQRWSYYQRRKANGGRPLRSDAIRDAELASRAGTVQMVGRSSFEEELKAFDAIKTILAALPDVSKTMVLERVILKS